MITEKMIREKIINQNLRMSEDFYNVLVMKIEIIVDSAIKRAKSNDRITVLPRDLPTIID